MTNRLAGKTVVVTGAAQGIGFAIAEACGLEGAQVVLSDIQDDVGSSAAHGLESQGIRAIYLHADVTDETSVERMIKQTVEELGIPNVLVNNAGVAVFRNPLEMTKSDWKECFSVDLDGVWNCSRAVLPHMLEQGKGDIINIASVHSYAIIPHCFPYPVAKHAVLGLTRALAIEYAAHDVRVNAIAPGYINTDIVRRLIAESSDPEEFKSRIDDLHPCGRMGRPEEIASCAVFLASDEARFLNAECITIDGGRSVLFHE